MKDGVAGFEAQKRKPIVSQERGNGGKAQPLLLDVKQQIAAAAHAKEITKVGGKFLA
ncbi:MAG TPA: hypothetical protein VGI89_11130 [Rhizomicrobium sp.]